MLTRTIYDYIRKLETCKEPKQREFLINQIRFLFVTYQQSLELNIPELKLDLTKEFEIHNTLQATLMMTAVAVEALEVVELLVISNDDVNRLNSQRMSPLCLAAQKNNVKICQYLIDSGANVNHHDTGLNKCKQIPLIFACSVGAYEATKFLLLNGADVALVGEGTETAKEVARRKNHKKCLSAIYAHEALQHAKSILANQESCNAISAGHAILDAIDHDKTFSYEYLVKIAKTAILRGQGLAHDENYYQPYILRIAMKHIKTYINTIPGFSKDNFPNGYSELTEALNAYDCQSQHFAEEELLFKTKDEKAKTLKWFEERTSIETTKNKMFKPKKDSQSNTKSPTSGNQLGMNGCFM